MPRGTSAKRVRAKPKAEKALPKVKADATIPDLEDLIAFDAKVATGIQSQLLPWYDENRRKLPWRGDVMSLGTEVKAECQPSAEKRSSIGATRVVSPYETWVSEIMCQQTRVDTVVGYFTKWMARFPTVKVLAEASPDDVNAMW
jgi:A/G-specific adenine glycosylase